MPVGTEEMQRSVAQDQWARRQGYVDWDEAVHDSEYHNWPLPKWNGVGLVEQDRDVFVYSFRSGQ